MPVKLILAFLLPFCVHHTDYQKNRAAGSLPQNNTLFEHVGDIPLPTGYTRLQAGSGSFTTWLRTIKVKTDKTVYLYDGTKKPNQTAQYAVLEVPVGNKDLQQCADAVMRLRAVYLLSSGRNSEIWFSDNAGKKYHCPTDPSPKAFENYLEKVYSFCGTSSLAKQLKPVKDFNGIQAGDVIIKGGSPGHAVIVIDVAQNTDGQRLFIIAQSYMPAQSVHILQNPREAGLSPWYRADPSIKLITTPEWEFSSNQLMRW